MEKKKEEKLSFEEMLKNDINYHQEQIIFHSGALKYAQHAYDEYLKSNNKGLVDDVVAKKNEHPS